MFEVGETNIICTDLKESRKFYEEILGFTFIEEEQGAVRLQCGNQYFLLLPFAKEKRKSKDYESIAELSFDLKTKDIQASYDYFLSKSVFIAKELVQDENSFRICDPDGLYLEIIAID